MLSFVVPAYNEELELGATIDAIKNAAASHQFEIIVVDDASSDATAKIAARSGARVVAINRRQIAAARNAGARASRGEILFFVDADTRINEKHVRGVIEALQAGFIGGGAQVRMTGPIPDWAQRLTRWFCALYFGLNFGAGAFLFTTRQIFDIAGGFDEKYFVGEEILFSLRLRKLGRFKILPEPVLTSGRKLRLYSPSQILKDSLRVILRGPRGARSRDGLTIWYDGRRETRSASTP
jgi:glycosyltransferase involved in cell wall biosynthesis